MKPSLEFLKDIKHKRGLVNKFRNNETLLKDLYDDTSFLNKDTDISERIYCLINDIFKIKLCDCGKSLKFTGLKNGYKISCDDKVCKSNARSRLNKESSKKIDWDKSIKKSKETMIQKYGVDHSSKVNEIKEKTKTTLIKKYGVSSPLKSKEILNKSLNSKKKKFGTLNMLGLEKTIKTNKERYGYSNPMKNKRISKKVGNVQSKNKLNELLNNIENINHSIKKIDKRFATVECDSCNNINKINRTALNYYIRNNINPCNRCNPKIHEYRSKGEINLGREIKKRFGISNIEYNRRYLLKGLESDIYLPDHNLIIEYNGLYCHSELNKPNDYHFRKKKLINDLGYKGVMIWEDDWLDLNKKEIILKRIENLITQSNKIGARKTSIKRITNHESMDFLNTNHLQGYRNAQIIYGVFHNNILLGVMSFNSIGKNEYELIRWSTSLNIQGGFTKCISKFKKDFSPNYIMTYADYDWSNINNNVYLNNGFKFNSITTPDYHWVISGIRESRYKWMKHNLVKLGYDKDKTELEIMHDLKYYRVFGCGNLKYELNL